MLTNITIHFEGMPDSKARRISHALEQYLLGLTNTGYSHITVQQEFMVVDNPHELDPLNVACPACGRLGQEDPTDRSITVQHKPDCGFLAWQDRQAAEVEDEGEPYVHFGVPDDLDRRHDEDPNA